MLVGTSDRFEIQRYGYSKFIGRAMINHYISNPNNSTLSINRLIIFSVFETTD